MYRFIYEGDDLKHFDDKMKTEFLNEPKVCKRLLYYNLHENYVACGYYCNMC